MMKDLVQYHPVGVLAGNGHVSIEAQPFLPVRYTLNLSELDGDLRAEGHLSGDPARIAQCRHLGDSAILALGTGEKIALRLIEVDSFGRARIESTGSLPQF
ncbi:hypothetical protein ACFQXB_12475 [Plastorhodobacter daqingensis]|uniref:Uncharacterized protein n=1 Tax=Plastorhodobacter daqingensis TaxID=1387281 RepID=A0ABW2ULB6_9RHOB